MVIDSVSTSYARYAFNTFRKRIVKILVVQLLDCSSNGNHKKVDRDHFLVINSFHFLLGRGAT